MKRFWTETAIAEDADGFTILLDGKPMRLPGGETLRLAHRPLAEAIAAEWMSPSPEAELQPQLLPLTQLAATAAFRIAEKREETATAIAAYGRSDLLCYRATDPAELVRQQQQAWQPWLDWAAQRHDAMLRVTSGIGFVEQSPQSLASLAHAVAQHDIHGLTALGVLVPAFGSLVLGLALMEGALGAEEAFRLSALDELFQEERWGLDHEAEARRARTAAEVSQAALYFTLTRGKT